MPTAVFRYDGNGLGDMSKKQYGFWMLRMTLLFLLGFCIYIYPFVADRWNAHIHSLMFDDYERVVVDNGPEERYQEMFDAASAYNRRLSDGVDRIIISNIQNDEYESLMNLNGNGIMGYIDIPKMQVNVPIYHYTTDEVLEQGIGHIAGSSLPVGGDGTHCVLTGHRGMPESKLFTDLDRLTEGDKFYIHILNKDIAYEVCDIQTVLPYELDSLVFEDDKDLVTLVTCTPYGVNTHRLLVTGKRTEYNAQVKSEEEQQGRLVDIQAKFTPQNGLVLGMVVFLLVMIVSFIFTKKGR